MQIEKIQEAICTRNLAGWLFWDFHNRDLAAYRILGLDATKFTSRRWFYFIPASGTPWKLVSRVESTKLDPLPGDKHLYLSWRELQEKIRSLLGNIGGPIAMQYSPSSNIPSVSIVDAGIMELIKAAGVSVSSSADLITLFEARISRKGYELHKQAARNLQEIAEAAFKRIGAAARKEGKKGAKENEYTIVQFILAEFKKRGMHWDAPPIVAVNEHATDPHFETSAKTAKTFKEGDQVLIDLWARMKNDEGIFADITWCAFIGRKPPQKYQEAFRTVVNARDEGIRLIKSRFEEGKKVYGFEVDDAVRGVVATAGFGEYFIHRTGHSIGREVHGNGPNLDNLETKDERELVRETCFSIEPGIYIDGELGVRSEINIFITQTGKVEVTTKPQKKLLLL